MLQFYHKFIFGFAVVEDEKRTLKLLHRRESQKAGVENKSSSNFV